MPFRYYHGRTGRIFTITRRGVGVVVAKRVRQRILNKRIYVRLEHVHPSRSREDFLKRVAHNTKARAATAGKEGVKADCTCWWLEMNGYSARRNALEGVVSYAGGERIVRGRVMLGRETEC